MRFLIVLTLAGALGIFGCGSDDGGGGGGSGGSGGTGGTGGSGGEGGTGGTAGSGGEGGTGGTAAAAAFCNEFEQTCTYGGNNYADRADCLASYEGYTVERQQCVMTHLGLAQANPADVELHCGHASGLAPCN